MWNDKETDLDLLGHERIAQTVMEIIRDQHLRPLTIGVYGDWGVGKSSILAFIKAKAEGEKSAKVSNSHCIMFNGWLFHDYEDAKTALMETVVAELASLQRTDKKIVGLVKSLFKRINWLKVAKMSASGLLSGLVGLPAAGLAGEVVKGVKAMTETKEGDSLLDPAEEETVTNQIHEFRKEFKELIQASKVDHVIVMVDDLDRCLPKAVIETLEAIKLFLFVEGTTFVISADERMIEYAVHEHFPSLPVSLSEYTKNYLEKLIQIPIRIPSLTKLQTGNYIKFLMLQDHLKNDTQKLSEVYEAFNKKKKRPYDPVELTYEIIKEVISTASTDLKETLLVAGQLTSTLSSGLKGNPRGTKRFLNTLFLRMRIAKIYGLDDIVELKVLAKLMLLERFQTETFNKVLEEVSLQVDGKSNTIVGLERELAAESASDKASTVGGSTTEEPVKDKLFREWAALSPSLGDVDLRPYIYISKEKAIGFDADGMFPPHLVAIATKLGSDNRMLLNQAEKELGELQSQERLLLYEKIESDCRNIGELKKIPPQIKGLLRIVLVEPILEERLLQLMESYPGSSLGPWAVTELSGLKTTQAKARFRKLMDTWLKSASPTLKSLIQQQLKR